MCQRWEEYVLLIESLMKLSEREEKSSESKGRDKIKKMKDVAREAAEHLEAMDATDFFMAYGGLKIERQKNIKRSGFVLLYLEENWFRKAVVAYFKKSPEMEVEAKKPAKGGVQQSLVVDINGRKSAYYAKVLGTFNKNYGTWPFDKPPVDLREIFVYRLLSSIGVGSKEVHVIPDVPNSGYVYLATKMIENFFTADGHTEDYLRTGSTKNDKSVKGSKKKAEDQLDMLGWLLRLHDLGVENKANYGFIARLMSDSSTSFELRIVDFRVLAKNANQSPYFPKAKDSKMKSEWKKFAEVWKLTDKIDEAWKKMEEDLAIRKRFEEDKNAYEGKNQQDQNLFDYRDGVKDNLQKLVKEEQSGSGAAKKPRTD
ncbi:unnamed protein product, partial [Mesorhabditis belari]|uniref:Uncharacterized protein n=1 Tax=Mesorhabditis belari TaxID=2138241 RepID=A0AAF3EQ12_9BILA